MRVIPLNIFDVFPRQHVTTFSARSAWKILGALLLPVVAIFYLNVSHAAAAETLTCFGDSITKGSPYVSGDGNGRVNIGGYEPDLHDLLDDVGLDFDTLNYGISGETTVAGVNRLPGVLGDHNSKYTLLLEGSNDVYYGISSSTTFANLRSMVDRCKSYGNSRIPLLGTILPREDTPIPSYYNDQIAAIAAEKEVSLVDHYSAFINDWDDLNYDGVHPNRAGYELMAETWGQEIIWLEIGAPENDDFVNAFEISGASGQTTGINRNATKEEGEPDHAGDAGGTSVWWTWVVPMAGSYYFDTYGSDFNTLLSIYTGSAVAGLSEVAANNDSTGGLLTSRAGFRVDAGQRLYIAVDGHDAKYGDITLNWEFVGAGCTDSDDDDHFVEPGCGSVVDCDDSDDQVNPGAAEACCDAKDNDCDGQADCQDVDSGCVCATSEVTIVSPADYETANFVVGSTYYLDRDFTLTTIPEALTTGTERLIKTRNDDKANTADDFLRFSVSRGAMVYVGYDPRGSVLPDWLENDFEATPLTIGVSDSFDSLAVYAREVPAGEVVLGGNLAGGASGAGSNYIVVVQGAGVALGCIKGDIDADGDVDLTDLILALQVLGGQNPGGVDGGAATVGDERFGMADALYILQALANFR